jgi:hypothetical protein
MHELQAVLRRIDVVEFTWNSAFESYIFKRSIWTKVIIRLMICARNVIYASAQGSYDIPFSWFPPPPTPLPKRL